MKWKASLLILGTLASVSLCAQPHAAPLVTQKIDNARLVTLHGTVHPLARRATDLGAVPETFSAERMILLLNRPPQQEAALQQFLSEAHSRGSASFHKWLTPAQFGEQFGPAEADIQTAIGWLSSQGFRVAKTSQGRQFIEFSGTAGQLLTAFHTEIHQYSVAGESHYANATDLKIPEALAPLVRGLAPLNDFRAKPNVEIAGEAVLSRGERKATPQWTAPNQYGTSNPYEFTVTPEDFATQYNLAPLYQAGVTGSGQTIGIINESNIDLSLVQAYQSLFGVAGTLPEVVIDGDDPGNLRGVDVEAYLDVEISGAVSPKATVNLYIAQGSYLEDPLALAAIRAIEDNQASVLSVSFGQCEYYLGNAGNQFWAGLWEQAAAQGQTVLVSSGDSGSECQLGLVNMVSGLASTPWNVAVGGTDFYYSDYATGGASTTTLWNTTNDANLGSLKAPLPEQPWDDPYGFNIIADSYQRGERGAAGGGVSNCSVVDSTTFHCASGYAKPSWQTGSGVPADKSRDIPDVSLFASNGANLSAIAICAYEGECAAGSGSHAAVLLVGGTSASAPAMAGIMALVNQKYGRQGQAGFTLYPLAQQKPAAFHDITLGTNSEVCGGVSNPPNCVLQWNGIYGSVQNPAGPGYDLASGLGSVDANALVNNWNAVTFQSTTTTLHLSSTSVTHGAPVTISATVSPFSGSGTPTGDVAILTDSALPASQGQTLITLSSGAASASVDFLPGGEYDLTAHYGGDATFAPSTSPAAKLTVSPEKSNINFSINNSNIAIAAGGSVQYNAPLTFHIQPTGVSATAGKTNGNATGTARFTVDSVTAIVALNSSGVANWTPPALSIGGHSASATYSGDASFAAATASAISFTVTKGEVSPGISLIGPYTYIPNTFGITLSPGSSLTIGVTVQGLFTSGFNPSQIPLGTAAPTGIVEICLTQNPNVGAGACYSPVYSQTVPLTALSGRNSFESTAAATFTNIAAGQYGVYYPSFQYSGDSIWNPQGLLYLREIDVQPLPAFAPTTTTLSVTPTSISGTQTAQITATVTGAGNAGTTPTGELDFYNNDVLLTYGIWRTGAPGTTSTMSFSLNASSLLNSGANQLTAMYWGDGANGPSVSNVVDLTANQTTAGDFTLAPQSPQITVKAGSTATAGLNLVSLSNFNGAVALTCTPSSTQFSCSVDPGSATVSGAATATVTIKATVPTTGMIQLTRQPQWPVLAGMLAFGLFLIGRRARRSFERSTLLCLGLLAALSLAGCGSSGSSSSTTNPPPAGSTPAGTYSVVVTGTANGIIHNAKITVVVQ